MDKNRQTDILRDFCTTNMDKNRQADKHTDTYFATSVQQTWIKTEKHTNIQTHTSGHL